MRPKWGFEGIDAPPVAEQVGAAILDAAFRIRSAVGPAALERVYARCLEQWLVRRGHVVEREKPLAVEVDGDVFPNVLRVDMVVDRVVVVELKAVETLLPVHEAQILSYLRVGGFPLGYLLNFCVPRMRGGIRRYVNTQPHERG